MDALKIIASEFTPEVILDPHENKFEISGESRPENWIDNYYSLRYWQDSKFKTEENASIFKFRLDYFNSTSAKFILDILKKLENFKKDEISISVNWYYEELDLDMKESGEEFSKMTEATFNLIKI
jgi:hypothetical protein